MILTQRRRSTKPRDHVKGDNTICRRTNKCEAGRGRNRARLRSTVSVPVTATAETTSQTTTTSPARELVERPGNEAGEDSLLVQMRRIAALYKNISDAVSEARRIHWRNSGKPKTQLIHLKKMLVEAALKGHVAAIGDCREDFHQSPLKPDGTECQVWIESPPEVELGPDFIREAVSAFPGLKGAPRAWDTYNANVLTSSMEMEQSRYDGCLFYRLEPRREHIEEKAGRHIDDFLLTGPEPNAYWRSHETS